MKILLVKPPLNKNTLSTTLGEPLELEYVAASVPNQNTEILDMRLEKKLIPKLERFKPDIVGITAYTCEANSARTVLKEVKRFNSRIKTVVGGHHATFLPNDFAHPYVDTVFLGFSDFSFRKYVDILDQGGDEKNVENTAYNQNGNIYFTERKPVNFDLNSLPWPARHLTCQYRKFYRDTSRRKTALLLTNRGCPYRCTFCACWKLMNGKYRVRDPESVVDEMAALPEDIDLVCFADDNTLHSISRSRKLIELMKKKKIKKKFTMYARAETIVNHPDLVEDLLECGLEYITVGIESFRDEELKRLKKQSTVVLNNEAIRILQRIGVSISAHLIVDPDYDKDDFKQLYEYVCQMKLFRPAFPVLTPLPGTELYEKNKNNFVIQNSDYFDFAHSILPTKLSRKQFYREVANLYQKSYSLKRHLFCRLKNLRFLSKKSNGYVRLNFDRLSLLTVLLIGIFAFPKFIRLRNSYKSEPFTQKSGKNKM